MRLRRSLRIATAALCGALLLAVILVSSPITPAAAVGRSVLIVAPHPDDDLLYGAGIVATAVAQGDSVKVVYMTNGDYYGGITEGLDREVEAVQGQQIIGDPENNLIFLGYPDGGMLSLYANYPNSTDRYATSFGQSTTYGNRGLGSADYHFYKFGTHATYNGANVLQDLQSILTTYRPDDIYTTGEVDSHPDHQATFWFVRSALLARMAADATYHPTLHKTIVHWEDGTRWPASTSPQTLMAQPSTLAQPGYAWSSHESIVVPQAMQSTTLSSNPKYEALDAHQTQGGAAGFLGRFVHKDEVFWVDPLTALPATDQNIAPLAAIMPSSEDSADDQQAVKAVDGVIDGWPGDSTREWATESEGTGAWLKLVWSSPVAISRIVLYDRPNSNDQITGATLSFSDGSSLTTGSLPNDGSALSLSFATRTVTSVKLAVTSVSSQTIAAGLAEIQVYGHAASAVNHAPTASAGTAQTVTVGSPVTLDGSASSDPDGDAITYAWTQTAGPSVSLSSATAAKPTFTAPASATSLTFQLVVSDGKLSSNPASVTITVQTAVADTNVAPQATVTASSQASSTGQFALKAVDGVIDGWPGDYTREWASDGGRTGAWLKLVWSSPVAISRIVLYDRPNSNDQITGATLSFSDGSSLTTGSLPNDGSALSLSFAARTVTSVQLTVTSVSSTTLSVGLAEIQVYGHRQ